MSPPAIVSGLPRRRQTVVLFAVLLALAALALYNLRPRTPVEPSVIVITRSWNNQWVPVGPEQSVRIELSSNPSTGYRWKLLSGRATAAPEITFPDLRPGSTGGSSVLQPFVVRYADLPTTVKLELVRPTTDQPPAQTFTVTLKPR